MSKLAIIAGGLMMLSAGLSMADEVRRGAGYRRFGAITQIAMGCFFIGYGFLYERFPGTLRFGWVVAAFVLAVAAWQVVTTVRRVRARGRTEAQRLLDSAAAAPEVSPRGRAEQTRATNSHSSDAEERNP